MKWWWKRDDQELQDQLNRARKKLHDTKRQDTRVNTVADRLRRHYEENQFAARIFQHLAEGR